MELLYVAWARVGSSGLEDMEHLLGNSADINPEHVGRVRVVVIGNSGTCFWVFCCGLELRLGRIRYANGPTIRWISFVIIKLTNSRLDEPKGLQLGRDSADLGIATKWGDKMSP